MTGTGTDPGTLSGNGIRLFAICLAFTLIVPAITTAVEFLITQDPPFRAALQVNLKDFHVYQLFTSSFVHLNFAHYLGNVTAYTLLAVYGLVLAHLLNRKRMYLVATKLVVGVFMVAGAVFTLFTMKTTYYGGLSGIDAALAGAVLLFWLVYCAEVSGGREITAFFGPAAVLLLAAFIGMIARYMLLYHTPRSPVLDALLLVCCGLLLAVLFVFRHQFPELWRNLGSRPPAVRIIAAAIPFILLYFIWNIFPERLTDPTRAVSISVHMAALVIGLCTCALCLAFLGSMEYFREEVAAIPSTPGNPVT